MKKRLIENMENQLVPPDPNVCITFDNMVAQWGSVSHPQVSVLLVHLRYLYFVHQTHHWTAKGDSYYGDHLLFQRLYESLPEEIDALAEKAIGLGLSENVNLPLQSSQLGKLVQGYGMINTIPHPNELAKRSMNAELNFLKCAAYGAEQMNQAGCMTRGLDNLLQGLEDAHEGHVYLLKQRCKP